MEVPEKPTRSDLSSLTDITDTDDDGDAEDSDDDVTDDTTETDDTGLGVEESPEPEASGPPYESCDEGRWPAPNWETGAPADHGMSFEGLEAAAQYAGSNQSQCMIVAKDGVIVGEWYWGITADTKVKNWSVAKSYAATVVGAAIDDGYLDSLDSPIADYVEEWQGTDKEAVSIHHMLSMSSGLRFGLFRDNVLMALAANMTRRALNNPLTNTPWGPVGVQQPHGTGGRALAQGRHRHEPPRLCRSAAVGAHGDGCQLGRGPTGSRSDVHEHQGQLPRPAQVWIHVPQTGLLERRAAGQSRIH